MRYDTYPLVNPLVHRRLPLLGSLDIEDFDEGFDGDSLKIRARVTHGRRRERTQPCPARIIGVERSVATRARS